jgi:Xaa-Pro aminopeptidase
MAINNRKTGRAGRAVEHFNSRIENFREKIALNNIDISLVTKEENIFYLTGFYGEDSGSILAVSGKNTALLNHFIYSEQARLQAGLAGLEFLEFTGDRKERLAEILHGMEGKNVGLDGENLSHNNYVDFSGIIRKQEKKEKNIPGLVESLRQIKDGAELDLIKKACSITDEATSEISVKGYDILRDFSEKELSMHINEIMVKKGASGSAFELIVASGPSSSLPHYVPGNNLIEKDILLLDLGCRYNNYCSDITRTLFLGTPGSRAKKFGDIYNIVLEAANTALEACRAGISCRELDKIARNVIEKAGYGENFGHGLGHGVGLQVHEEPIVSYKRDTMLEENMVITIEPGIYLEGEGGVRIEDMVVVKKNNAENLYQASRVFNPE